MSSEQAIILKRTAFGEADWIVTFFSREKGRMTGFAKSARKSMKRFGGAFEPGTLVEMKLASSRGQGLVRIEEARVIRPILGAMKTLERINVLSRSLKLALAFLQEHQAAQEKFDLLEARIRAICAGNQNMDDSVEFELKWLSLCGFAPGLGACMECGKERALECGAWVFDYDRGGIICSTCSGGGYAARGIRVSHSADLSSILDGYINYIVGRPVGPTAI